MDCKGATSASAAAATAAGTAASAAAASDYDSLFDWHTLLDERDCKFLQQVHEALPTPPQDMQTLDIQGLIDENFFASQRLPDGDSFQDRLAAIDKFVYSVAQALQPRDGQECREFSTVRPGAQSCIDKGNGCYNAVSLVQGSNAKGKLSRASTPTTSNGRVLSKQESVVRVLGQSPPDDWGDNADSFPSSSPSSGLYNGQRKRKRSIASKAATPSASSSASCANDVALSHSLHGLCNIHATAMRYLHKHISKQLCYLSLTADMAHRTQRFGEHRRRLQALVEALLQHRRPIHLRRKIYSSIPALQRNPTGAGGDHCSNSSGNFSTMRKGAVVDVLWKQEWRKGVILGWKFDCGWPQYRQVKVKISVSSDTVVRWIAADSGNIRSTEESLHGVLSQLTNGHGFESHYTLRTSGQHMNGVAEAREGTGRSNHKHARPAKQSPEDAMRPPEEAPPAPTLAISNLDLPLQDFANVFDHPFIARSLINSYMSVADPTRATMKATMQPNVKVDTVLLAGSDPRRNPFLRLPHQASTMGSVLFLEGTQAGATFKIDVEGVVIKN